MALRFIGIDPNTDTGNCPTVWFDPESNEFVLQGWNADAATQAECLSTGPIPDTESVIRMPARMAQALREACDVADGSGL